MSSNIRIRRVFNPLRGDYEDHFVEINLLERGEAEFHYGNGMVRLEAPACVVAYSDESLHMHNVRNMSVMQMRFSAAFLPSSFMALEEATALRRFSILLEDGAYVERMPHCRAVSDAMAHVSDATGVASVSRLYELLTLLSSSCHFQPFPSYRAVPRDTGVHSIVSRVDTYMAEHLGAPITLKDLAPLAGVTPASFCRAYKRTTGQSPMVRLNQLRVQEACRLLRDTDLTVKEIAYKCGYQEPHFFHQLFKREIGYTPQTFRKIKR